MIDYKAWLAGEEPRVMLAVVNVESSGSAVTRYLSDGEFRTGTSENPAHTIFLSRIMGGTEIQRTMGSVFGGRGGNMNGGELLIANSDGQLDSWRGDEWVGKEVTIYYGRPTWTYSQITSNGQIFKGRTRSLGGTDTELRLVMQGIHYLLDEPAQTVMESHGPNRGGRRMLCYGYPKNVEPQYTATDPDDYYYRVHENDAVEDVAVNRYINQAVSTSPAINKLAYNAEQNDPRHIEFVADPAGAVTIDVKGAKDAYSGGTWIQTPGAALKHLLTREHPDTVGIARGGTSSTIQLELKESSTDDEYNTETIRKSDSNIDGGEDVTVDDYTGSTRTVTISGTWSGVDATQGDGYELLGRAMQAGAFDTADLDTSAFDQLDTDLSSPEIGFVVDQEQTFREVLEMVLGPGAYYGFTRAGLLTVGLLVDPSNATADLTLGENDLWSVIEWEKDRPPVERLRVGYDKNWTVNRGASTGDAKADRQEYASREFLWSVTNIDESQDQYVERDVKTMLTTESDAETERDRLWNLFSVQRYRYTIQCLTKPLQVDLGDVVELTDSRYELSAKNLVVVSMRESPLIGKTELVLWG